MSVPRPQSDDAAGLLVDAGADGAHIDDANDPASLLVAFPGDRDPRTLAGEVVAVLAELGLRIDAREDCAILTS